MICIFGLPSFQRSVKIIESLFFLHLRQTERLHGLQMLFVLQVFYLLLQRAQFSTTYVRQSLPHLLQVLLLVLLLGLSVRQLLGGGQTRRVKSIVLGVGGVCGRRL